MPTRESTSQTLIAAATAGNLEAREEFARIYGPVVLAYLNARWKGSTHLAEREDAVQEVFLDCFREDGALARLDPDRPQRFRSYLFGITRNVARHFEARLQRRTPVGSEELDERAAPLDDGPSHAFDRAWAEAILREALARLQASARVKGGRALRRVELLRLRFDAGQPIREIARAWNEAPARVHKQYAQAREDFKGALKATLADHGSVDGRVTDEDLRDLLELLGTG